MGDFYEAVGTLWAKTNAGGRPHSLIGHLLDSAATTELIWDEYLAPSMKARLDAVSESRGCDLLVLLAGWHDLGKATPAFQHKAVAAGHPELLRDLNSAGLSYSTAFSKQFSAWPHGAAGAVVAADHLMACNVSGWEWLIPLIAGHHGRFEAASTSPSRRRAVLRAHGTGLWNEAQQHLAGSIAQRIGVRLDSWRLTTPDRGTQLALAGLVVMADWIASSDLFPGRGLVDMTMDEARVRARQAWQQLRLAGGWNPAQLLSDANEFQSRFAYPPRELQKVTIEAAARNPGLVVVEAPMGEGKTEAAEAAAEVLARLNGANGMVFAMPTQGTTDAMYERVLAWVAAIDPALPVSLLHGKAMLNDTWRQALDGVAVDGVHDEFGMADEYGTQATTETAEAKAAPSSWLLGRHRGLLAHAVVATIDQVLWAATRTKYVSLRYAGLAGRVLIIDEVHSYDAYMGVFLQELLRWCARLQVPVILMSATLAPGVRLDLVNAWRHGRGLPAVSDIPSSGYPRVLSVHHTGQIVEDSCRPARSDLEVEVSVLSSSSGDDVSDIATSVADRVSGGGCALVILNTVARAQGVYRVLRDAEVPALLIHGRLTAAERAARTSAALDALGPAGHRPERLVVVATQIAEQSFDVDADVLYSDIAPLDLLLQRVGRLHRHDRAAHSRPDHLRVPRLVVTGLWFDGGFPAWPHAFAPLPGERSVREGDRPHTVYRARALLAACHAVRRAETWKIPSQVPELVAEAYATDWSGPEAWAEAVSVARETEDIERAARELTAAQYRLDADPENDATNLWELHAGAGNDTDNGRRPVVRDGDDTLEVSLIRRTFNGYQTLGGRPVGAAGERVSDPAIAREVLGDSVRLRWRAELDQVRPLPQWVEDRFLAFTPVLVLDADGSYDNGRLRLHYDVEVGLTEW